MNMNNETQKLNVTLNFQCGSILEEKASSLTKGGCGGGVEWYYNKLCE